MTPHAALLHKAEALLHQQTHLVNTAQTMLNASTYGYHQYVEQDDTCSANTLAMLIRTITQELSPLQELERGQTWPALITETTLELGDSPTAQNLRTQALTLFTPANLPANQQLEQCVIAITAMATLVNSLAYYGGGPNVLITPLLEWYAPTKQY